MPIFIIALYTTELIPGACHFPSYKVNVNSLSFGKRVGQNLYIYVDDLEKENNVLHQFVRRIHFGRNRHVSFRPAADNAPDR